MTTKAKEKEFISFAMARCRDLDCEFCTDRPGDKSNSSETAKTVKEKRDDF